MTSVYDLGLPVEASEVLVADQTGFRPAREGDSLHNVGFVFFSDPDGNA